MKCYCDECGGTGQINCPECEGQGEQEGDIADIKLERNMKHYDDLIECQKDARRVIKQAERLTQINPNRMKSYEAQLSATLFIINAEADKISKRK